MPRCACRRELRHRSGRSLTRIVEAASGGSVTGLVGSARERAAQLSAQVKAKRLSPAAERRRLARLRGRVTAELGRPRLELR